MTFQICSGKSLKNKEPSLFELRARGIHVHNTRNFYFGSQINPRRTKASGKSLELRWIIEIKGWRRDIFPGDKYLTDDSEIEFSLTFSLTEATYVFFTFLSHVFFCYDLKSLQENERLFITFPLLGSNHSINSYNLSKDICHLLYFHVTKFFNIKKTAHIGMSLIPRSNNFTVINKAKGNDGDPYGLIDAREHALIVC